MTAIAMLVGSTCVVSTVFRRVRRVPDKLDTIVRLLFWIALIAAAFWLWRKFKISQQSRPVQRSQKSSPYISLTDPYALFTTSPRLNH
ncbi:hypothetical protein G7009_09710 [Pseudomonas capeferrum]|uniref:hypothetical protein n=1 Tax=Pseudomonas capeferrum TaxID=1495066 RepID=UPI0015E323E8|nr:hypothetical protein [Pseudomonas capeferrum]MBA1202035.1 hypothetical protein [Pseudomonas capeferrum]